MKTGNTHFMQVSRDVWDYGISDKAKMLFFWLNELEQRYTGKDKEWFFRSDEQLANDLHWSLKTLKIAKSELKDTDLIRCSFIHWWQDESQTKLSKKHITVYRIQK